MDKEMVARILHEANRAFGNAFCGDSHKPWDEAEEWQRKSSRDAVAFHIANPDASDSATHDKWLEDRRTAGWTWGPVRDDERKTNPALVEYDQLPKEQRFKDTLQKAIVAAAVASE